MAKRKSPENMAGSTFADLYDAQQEHDRRSYKPMGRPKKKVSRKPYTIHLTKEEATTLRRLELLISEYSSINRSEITGIALEIMMEVMTMPSEEDFLAGVRDTEDIFNRLKNVMMS